MKERTNSFFPVRDVSVDLYRSFARSSLTHMQAQEPLVEVGEEYEDYD